MRIAVVGAGPWALETHYPALLAHPDVDVVGGWTRRPEAAGDLPVSRFESVEAMLDAADAVSLAVPPDAQAPIALQAVRAGKHVILDKPIAGSVEQAAVLADAVEAAGVTSIVTFTRRFAPETRAFLDAARSGQYGGGIGRWLSGALLGGRYSSSQWRKDGGALLDVGPHVVDLLDAALGEVTEVVDARLVPDDLWHITLGHAGGATSALQLSLCVPARPTVTEFAVHGRDGVVSLTDRSTSSVDCFTTLIDEFLASAASGTPHACDVHRGLHVQEVLGRVLDAVG
ncbi:Gfo/Idh/MocA family protein [Williamsia deligens]|uniref:Gfo/Idh/MocA family protein n=1 Tax=Williamsia deligens TaxID=321325 RepID=A0ABW3G708_9NOCA|nr:Gfo/Idh/MocA family oxidoreductase [Williamsia deligens]MCP2193297.1 putative dehydrogenase [Williamsia deligens]